MTGIEAGKTWSRIGAEVAPTSSAASGVWGSLNEVSGYVGAGTWPSPPVHMEWIAELTPDGTSTTVEFTSVPGTYKYLRLVMASATRASSGIGMMVYYNSDTNVANYGWQSMYNLAGGGPSAVVGATANPGWDLPDDEVAHMTWDIANYADSSVGTNCLFQGSGDGSQPLIVGGSGYAVNAVVTEVKVISGSTTSNFYFQTGTTFNLYGIGKAA